MASSLYSALLSFAILLGLSHLVTATPAPQQQIASPSDGDSSSWQKYVRAPSSKVVLPKQILSQYTAGDVNNPSGLVAGNGPTVLTCKEQDDDIPTIVVDFGQNYAGLLTIDFDGAKTYSSNDTTGLPGITLAFSETLEGLTNRSDFTRSDNAAGAEKLTNGTDQIAVKLEPYTWLAQHGCEYGTQVCVDGLHGFRYLKIRLDAVASDAPYTIAYGSVSIKSVSLEYSGFLGTPDTFTGWFECSDEDITQWWYDAVYTNDLCTDIFRANDTEPRDATSPTLLGKLVLHDGAKRDRDPYVGDLAVSALTSYVSHNVPSAARNVLEDLGNHQREDGWIPPASIVNYTLPLFDYPLWWVVCISDHVLYTGNMTFLETFYPNIVKVLDTFYPSMTNATTGLIERPDGYGDYAFLPRNGPITYYNALYITALTRAADLADMLGKSNAADASTWRSRASKIGPALINENYDDSVGAFLDGGSCDGAKCAAHPQDGNSLAILSGATNTTARAESILSYLASALARPYGNAFYDTSVTSPSDQFDQRVYAFISYFELAARFSASNDTVESAFEELRRLYGWMSTHDPYSTFWEGIGTGGGLYEGGFTSMAHGWSTGIVPLMMNYVLGVTPTGSGFGKWIIKPIMDGGGLTWARGRVPTPYGPIDVFWEKEGKGLSLKIDTPKGTAGDVKIPLPDESASVAQDGNTIYSGKDGAAMGSSIEDGRLVVSLNDGGSYVFIIQ